MKKHQFNTDIGSLELIEEDDKLSEIRFLHSGKLTAFDNTTLLKEAKSQLLAYFDGKLKRFDLPLKIEGSDFKVKVLKALINIPYGKLVSYKEIAIEIGNEKASRAVGGANNKNKIPIIIPCHRVIGVNKKLIGYAGGLKIKKRLINMEMSYLGLQPQYD